MRSSRGCQSCATGLRHLCCSFCTSKLMSCEKPLCSVMSSYPLAFAEAFVLAARAISSVQAAASIGRGEPFPFTNCEIRIFPPFVTLYLLVLLCLLLFYLFVVCTCALLVKLVHSESWSLHVYCKYPRIT